MAELTSIVHVHDEHGDVHVFGPGVTVPAWAKALITNPKAWSEGIEPVKKDHPVAEPTEAPDSDDVPAKSGPKATVDAWTAYAEKHKVSVGADATRKDIIAALEAAGVPTE
ncbi:hypothetical protein IT072_02400 [Leifsonia sp. ZF2019]|uniref:hypothetical protein n=1 Tax=Leifsonia sp. ZF2019 TaxID=2781978 RepID=UPI001CC08010|nr:hypothetical protein [Leifsonia sp. ZF2019]UAJ78318.1 hypothetical protein IT072_13725 [Leifsonia sp. ZF2019]UAJ79948.1 hypothetical protein IT072_02400 [Leifsonia sp. ZF2019]